MNLEIIHVSTCLPDYWSGHHKAHVCVPVWNGITFDELKSSLHSEISQGAVCGSDKISELLGLSGNFSEDEIETADKAAHDAVDGITLADGANPNHLFGYLDETDETDGVCFDETVYAYFLIVDTEG